mmetsp:Transcript_7627/g.23465  ORF Transcript_7627/g.23465 Transcript_7627/m.23465 type:complete len:236 (-) Transcript_7627:654-1361(-)
MFQERRWLRRCYWRARARPPRTGRRPGARRRDGPVCPSRPTKLTSQTRAPHRPAPARRPPARTARHWCPCCEAQHRTRLRGRPSVWRPLLRRSGTTEVLLRRRRWDHSPGRDGDHVVRRHAPQCSGRRPTAARWHARARGRRAARAAQSRRRRDVRSTRSSVLRATAGRRAPASSSWRPRRRRQWRAHFGRRHSPHGAHSRAWRRAAAARAAGRGRPVADGGRAGRAPGRERSPG